MMLIADRDQDIRITGLRLARRMQHSGLERLIEELAGDGSPAVRRECAIALRHVSSEKKISIWTSLALSLAGNDRWYLESLGIALDADSKFGWDAALANLLKTRKDANSANFELIWRSRGKETTKLKLAELIHLIKRSQMKLAPEARHDAEILDHAARLFRSLDFDDKTSAAEICSSVLRELSGKNLPPKTETSFVVECLERIGSTEASQPAAKEALARALLHASGTSEFVHLVKRFQIADRYPEVLSLAQSMPAEQVGVEAISALLELKQWDLLGKALTGADTAAAMTTAEAMGNSQSGAISGPLLAIVRSADVNTDVRRTAVKAASRVDNGAEELIKLIDEKMLDPELEQSVAAALHSAPSRQARDAAQRLFPLPPSKDNMPTPPISELTRLNGSLANGRMVFFSTGTCHKCHVVDGMGREIGPNLTEIGSKLSRDAMFESVLYPSAGISHNFELWTVVLDSGTTVNGMLTSNTDAEISIKGDDALVRSFKKSDVEELVKQKISMMPADLQKTMTTQELADVVEYMQSLKKK